MAKSNPSLADVDWTAEGVGPFVKVLSDYYLHTQNTATPRNVRPLLDYLYIVHGKNKVRMDTEGLGSAHQQFESEWLAYNDRLAGYRVALNEAFDDGADTPTAAFYERVVDPLLKGWFPGVEVRRVPDAATAIIQARQIGVARKALDEAWEQLKTDLKDRAAGTGRGMALAAVVGALAAIWLSRD
jgi:hypothetical protein